MFAIRVTVRIEPGREEEARKGLVEQVVPQVKGTPGFVAGYWFQPTRNQGSSVVLWDTRAHADAAAAQLQPGTHPSPPVTVEQVEVGEVIYSV